MKNISNQNGKTYIRPTFGMNTLDFINNAEYLIRQCLNQKNIDPTMEAWLRDACLDLAKAREKDTSLEADNEKLKNILRKAFPEKSGHFFICGESGEQDSMGLPDNLFVCPAYGLDGFAVYKKDRDYDAPGW